MCIYIYIYIYINTTQYNSTNAHSYKVVMYIQKFFNPYSSDDGPKLDKKGL